MLAFRFAAWLAPSLLVAVVLLCSGCGGGRAEDGGPSGSVRVDGSSTVFPITEAVAEEFMEAHRGARVTVGVSGTGGGFSKFARGETDINDASRPIRETEIEQMRAAGLQFIELPIAYDGLAVVTHPANDWAECLTVAELQKIWEPGSTVDSWQDVRPSFPDRPLTLFGPGTASGTYDYFTEAIGGEGGASRSDFTASEDDNVLVQGLEGSPGSLGYFGLAYYEENARQLKLLGITTDTTLAADGAPSGCVKPSTQTVQNNTYKPLSRPLFIYVGEESAADSTVQAFTNFYIENAGPLAEEVGYVALPAREYDLVAERFRSRTTGTLFGGEGAQVGLSIEQLMQQTERATPDSATDTAGRPSVGARP